VSQAKKIHEMIQKIRDDELKKRWRSHGSELYPLKVERDKQCEEIQEQIRRAFPDDFTYYKGDS
jgi:hypothetical protein